MMRLRVWMENDDGQMHEAGMADIEGDDQSEARHKFIAEDVSKQFNDRYVQLWYGLECRASAGEIRKP